MSGRKIVVIGGALAVSAAVFFAMRVSGPDPVAVATAVAERRPVFQSFVTASGEIVAARYADIGSSVMGKVVSLRVREGDRVRAGQTLAQIDSVQARSETDAADAQILVLQAEQAAAQDQITVARAELEAAEAKADEAARARERALILHTDGLLPVAERDAAVAAAHGAAAQAKAARAGWARAEQTQAAAGRRIAQATALAARARDVLGKTTITSPIDGVVSRLRVREGEMVVVGLQNQPGTTLMTISDLSTIDAEVKVAEAQVLRLALDQPATVTLDAVPDQSFAGRVVEIGTSALSAQGAGAAAREFRVVLRLTNGARLRPGMTCDAEILAQQRRDAIVVPLQAVVVRAPSAGAKEQTGVYVVRDRRAVFTAVTAGIIGGLSIEVSGVESGARVVAGPYQVLRALQPNALVEELVSNTPE